MVGKLLELLSEIAPGLKRAAIMFDPETAPVSVYLPSFETAARSLNVVPIIAPVHNDVEIETVIIALGREPGGGLVVVLDVFMTASDSTRRALAVLRFHDHLELGRKLHREIARLRAWPQPAAIDLAARCHG
jgi:putative ABC transport system substrate-binding protein